MGYSFFLFAKLHEVVFGVSDQPYDAQYEKLYTSYNRYKASPYNNPDFGEYSCMVDYLQDLKFTIEHFNQYIEQFNQYK